MKDIKELNYYEMLKVPADASLLEIRRAYNDSLSLYGNDSLATYSLFTENARKDILKTLETAFRTLTDPSKRTAYNQVLIDKGALDPASLTRGKPKKPVPLFESTGITNKANLKRKISIKIDGTSISQLARDIAAAEEISGRDLKKLREKIGVSLEEIYDATRISISTIKAIETNDFKNLPSAIYLKNFLRAYASLVNLDPQMVIKGYLKHAGIK
jgi:DnaJ-class molecular chaperone